MQTVQCSAAQCNALQRAAVRCNALQRTAAHCNALQRTATRCSALQCTAAHCNILQYIATLCSHEKESEAQTWRNCARIAKTSEKCARESSGLFCKRHTLNVKRDTPCVRRDLSRNKERKQQSRVANPCQNVLAFFPGAILYLCNCHIHQ